MHNTMSMSPTFEREKNLKASLYTAGIALVIFLVFIWVKMTIPHTDPPPVEDYMDINLGSGDQGFGTDQPQLPGDPAPAQASYTPPQAASSREEAVRDVSENSEDRDDPPVVKPAVSRPEANRINTESRTTSRPTPATQPVTNPAPPQPKAVAGRTLGGNGNGGNGADTYKPGGNEGIAGGNGDQGRPGGDPNGRNYSGTPRNLGVKIVNMPSQSFEDDFNESGTIVLEVVVDENGKLTSATYHQSGSTLPKSSKQYTAAVRRATSDVRWPKMEGGFRQRVSFNFKVR
jgi:hypothetical protein